MADEHKPMTEEDIALDEAVADHGVDVAAYQGPGNLLDGLSKGQRQWVGNVVKRWPRALAEVRRLRKMVGNRANYSDEESEAAWKHYLDIRRQIRESNSDDEKGPLMAQAVEHAKKYGISNRSGNDIEITALKKQLAELQYQHEADTGTIGTLEGELKTAQKKIEDLKQNPVAILGRVE